MDAKKLALLVGALVVAAITAVMAKHMANAGVAPQVVAAYSPAPSGPQVLVATKPLPVGTIIGPDVLRYQPWPKDMVDGAYFVRGAAGTDPAKMQGMVVRTAITAGQPLTQGALVKPGDRGFLAAALTPGMRAVTVSVSAATAVAGFIFPGDRVDVLLSQEVTGGDGGQSLKASETIARNMRVLATDQRTDNQPDAQGKTQIIAYSMVTLEATPKLAEKVAVAQKIGTLSLSLRPLSDDTRELEAAIAAGDVTVPDGSDPKAERSMLLQLANQPQDSRASFTTGGEVSRFQRNTMPAAAPAAPAAPGGAPAQPATAATPAPAGPVIRVARGNAVSAMPVGGK
ncbi:Flp pilus assembly protein CpaB [Sphingomonas morindae]|uniref:Flp pilus assembly protein CpaB n=1 Tax=Sphingomonas morindae TaxID=1541170 RepID=A0ABY4X4W3_9SPHN|nr:Flp pilus assembly protein CpaB [Sphingomonas morindae]USI71939.1 Flp pilus assembly protein CpaB [Sphingomonas morindae]